jgi:hypothetical protein
MCYTGQCPYEVGYGEYVGECRALIGDPIPPDAICMAPGDLPDKAFMDEVERIKVITNKEGRFRILDLAD